MILICMYIVQLWQKLPANHENWKRVRGADEDPAGEEERAAEESQQASGEYGVDDGDDDGGDDVDDDDDNVDDDDVDELSVVFDNQIVDGDFFQS